MSFSFSSSLFFFLAFFPTHLLFSLFSLFFFSFLVSLSLSQATSLLSSAAPPLAPVSQRGGLLHTTQDVSLTNSSSIDLDTSEESIPLKIAVIETCNALFKGEKLEGYMVKLSGEVAMSFPSAYLSKISPSLPLKFKVNKKGAELERLLHDRNFLKM